MSKAIERLEKLAKVCACPDWGGDGEEPVCPEVIAQARVLLDGVKSNPHVVPGGNGTINIEFESADGAYLELEAMDGTIWEYLFKSAEVPEREGSSNGVEALALARVFDPDEVL